MRKFLLLFSLAALVSGCATDDGIDPQPDRLTPRPKVAPVPAGLKVHVNDKGSPECPVMKNEIDPGDAVGFYDHNGVRYYFCCNGCPEKFKQNPEKYTEK